jgi:hypothetical protein
MNCAHPQGRKRGWTACILQACQAVKMTAVRGGAIFEAGGCLAYFSPAYLCLGGKT